VLDLELQRTLYDEPALRAVYLRIRPHLETLLANQTEYKVAHILVATEARARAARAAIVGGASFADQARKLSADPGSKNRGGDLGWMHATWVTDSFTTALSNAKGPGLLPVVKTRFGWHVVRLDGIRPQPAPSFDEMRATIMGVVLNNEVLQYEEQLRSKASAMVPGT
jgi:peptidyl-prolyl cis-trans isomerase C